MVIPLSEKIKFHLLHQIRQLVALVVLMNVIPHDVYNQNQPFQPKNNKGLLLGLSNNGRNLMASWYKSYPWLTLSTSKKKAFCIYCQATEGQNMLFSKMGEATFTIFGYNNWKKALEIFNHQKAVIK